MYEETFQYSLDFTIDLLILNSGYVVGKFYLVKSGGELCPARVSFKIKIIGTSGFHVLFELFFIKLLQTGN